MSPPLRVLALNAFHGGSHRAFLEDWSSNSRHDWTLLTLPARKWKWRMRHAAITFAEMARDLVLQGETFDVLFCTDMLNLAEFLGLCPPGFRDLPRIVYFHENQLTYPQQDSDERDLHFAFTNFTTALAADEVWFNSQFHHDEFFAAFGDWLPRLPDHQPLVALEAIRKKSHVQSPGIRVIESSFRRKPYEPLTILWVSRWEHDKNPELFFQGLKELARFGMRFWLNVLGESYSETPACFEEARTCFRDQIRVWGFLPDRNDYERAICESDVVVSTADHEFFGIAILEAVSAGCFPLVPKGLAYPETLGSDYPIFHQGTAKSLCSRLIDLTVCKAAEKLQTFSDDLKRRVRKCHGWPVVLSRLDAGLDAGLDRLAAGRG